MLDDPTTKSAVAALSEIREVLQADGYELAVGQMTGDTLEIEVLTLDGACDDCLVAKDLMATMISDALPDGLGIGRIQLTYPTD